MTAAVPLRVDGTPRLRGVEVDPVRGYRFRSLYPDVASRFWSKVQRADGCWLWVAARSRDGYGKFQVRRRVSARAHRVAWELTYGEIPAGMVVRHDCDIPLCVRPDHLRLGTQRENIRDALRRGRLAARGKVGAEEVRAIRRRAAAGEAFEILAKEYGLCPATIDNIVRRRRWARVALEEPA